MIAYKKLGFHLSLRRGMTLTEMLVATAMTLVIMGVVVQLFGMVVKVFHPVVRHSICRCSSGQLLTHYEQT